MKSIVRRTFAVLAITFLSAPALPIALAIQQAEVEEKSPWLQWLVTLVLAGACVAILFKNPKRSHQG